MAFNVQCFGRVSSSGNLTVRTLQDGTLQGAPGMYTYISATDTVATIEAADYFASQASLLNVGDFIYCVGSDTEITLNVAGVTLGPPPSVITVTQVGVGNVNGPALGSATDKALVRWNGTTGRLIENSVAILTDAGALSGLTGLVSSGLTYPTVDGTAGEVMVTNGAGVLSFSAAAMLTWSAAAVSGNLAVNHGYVTTGAGLITLTLPAVAALGSEIKIAGQGAGGWLVAQNAGQSIHFSGSTTTVGAGGSLASGTRYDSLSIVCVVANNEFTVTASIGNLTIV